MSLQAWVDESGADSRADPNTYILAAAVCADEHVVDARAAMRALQLRGQRKVHWRTEADRRRRRIVAVLAAAPLDYLVVVRTGLAEERTERRRRRCLERMLLELDALGVGQVLLESRGPRDDGRDREMLQYLRRSRSLPSGGSGLRMAHAPGPSDPLLWAPDAVCGAVTQNRTGTPDYLDVLAPRTQVIALDEA